MIDSPARILQTWAVAQSLVQDPLILPLGDWPGYVSRKPDAPDNVVIFYNTMGLADGRYMRGGQPVRHPGVLIMVRATDEPTAVAQIDSIVQALNAVTNVAVSNVGGSRTYTLVAASQKSDYIPLGDEETVEEKRRGRVIFVVNYTVTITN